jgi:hypothetical protein
MQETKVEQAKRSERGLRSPKNKRRGRREERAFASRGMG